MKTKNLLAQIFVLVLLPFAAIAETYEWRTLAGTPSVAGATDSPAVKSARFNAPFGVAVGPGGIVFVADWGNHTIRRIMPNGVVSTLAGRPGVSGNTVGVGAAALFDHPYSIAVDSALNVYVADWNRRICKISPIGTVSLIYSGVNIDAGIAVNKAGNCIYALCWAGQYLMKFSLSGSTWTGASFVANSPSRADWLALDDAGNLFTASSDQGVVYKLDQGSMNWTLLAGQAGLPGNVDGSGSAARFNGLKNIAVNNDGTLVYVTDFNNLTVRKIALGVSGIWTTSTLAGDSLQQGSLDGAGSGARFQYPGSIGLNVFNSSDQLYLADWVADVIRKIVVTASPAVVSTFAGLKGSPGSEDGPNSGAKFYDPRDTAIDAAGNIYVADYLNSVIRKIAVDGTVTTFAGSPGLTGSTDGAGGAARFRYPSGLSLAGSGYLFVSDTGNQVIRMISPAGVVTTIAGMAGASGSSDGTGNAARFNTPRGLAATASGSIVYVADSANNTIRKLTLTNGTWAVSTLAGSAGQSGSTDVASGGNMLNARFSNPNGVALNAAGNRLYVADTNNSTIRVVYVLGSSVLTYAGVAGQAATVDGFTYSNARFNAPMRVAVGGTGESVYVTQFDHAIRRITTGVKVTTVAGTPGTSGYSDGVSPAAPARLSYPMGLSCDSAGNAYFADSGNHVIRKVNLFNVVTTISGVPQSSGTSNSAVAQFYNPCGLDIDSTGSLYVADATNQVVRKVSPVGVVTTIAGQSGVSGSNDGTLTTAHFRYPNDLRIGANGMYIADYANNAIRVVQTSGVTTLAGLPGGSQGSVDGLGAAARFGGPTAAALDGAGNLYVVDRQNHTIRKITITNGQGTVTTIAGMPGIEGYADGPGSSARFAFPASLTVNSAGDTIFVTDEINHAIRKLTRSGSVWVVSTLAGLAGTPGWVDGSLVAARFRFPYGIFLDNSGALYVTEYSNNTIRKISPSGVVSTIGGTGSQYGNTDGVGTTARFNRPIGIVVDVVTGIVYVSDTANHTIRAGVPYL